VLFVSVVLLGACATAKNRGADPPAGSGRAVTSAPSAPSGPGTTAAPSTTTSAAPPARITINFAGDINFEGPRAQRLAANPATVLAEIAGPLGAADLTVVNLETAITQRGTPAPKAFTFRAPPSALVALRDAGVDVASIANNHGLDYGPVGVEDALAASAAEGFPLIGIGRDETQALAPYRTTIRGHRVAVIAATQVLDTELIPAWTATADHPGLASAKRVDELLAQVRLIRPTTDTLVVFLHWGIETHTCPSGVQQELAHQLVEAGADVVVGGHAHRVQGGGRLGTAIVDYGLGNFAFYAGSEAAATTGILQVTVGGGEPAQYRWLPARIGAAGVPSLLQGQAATSALASWNALRGCTGLTS
jgi:poly-gamma-glutamate synthesis protein (capsule biosynthesis protein)